MKQAFGISPINHVRSFWCAPVPFKLLVSFGGKAKAHLESAQNALIAIQDNHALSLVDPYPGHLRPPVSAELTRASRKQSR